MEYATKRNTLVPIILVFVAGFCTNAVRYYCSITSTIPVYFSIFTFLLFYRIWRREDGFLKVLRNIDAAELNELVKKKRFNFFLIFLLAVLCTIGELRPVPNLQKLSGRLFASHVKLLHFGKTVLALLSCYACAFYFAFYRLLYPTIICADPCFVYCMYNTASWAYRFGCVCMQPETISNVFCKIDDKNQLECVVDVTYYHFGFELGPESEKRCQTVSRDDYGDFCGA